MKLPVISKAQRLGAILFLAAVCCFGPKEAYAVSTAPPGCQGLSTITVPSPDGNWDAVLHTDFCEFGYAFTGYAGATVTIISRKNHTKQKDVYSIPDNGDPNYRPKISWIDSSELLISTRHSRFIGLQENKFEKIKISYTYQAPPPLPTRVPKSKP